MVLIEICLLNIKIIAFLSRSFTFKRVIYKWFHKYFLVLHRTALEHWEKWASFGLKICVKLWMHSCGGDNEGHLSDSRRESAITAATSRTHLKRVPTALLLQELRIKQLPDEPLGIVDRVLGVAVRQVHGFVSGQNRSGGERNGARDALPALLIGYHLHLSTARMKDAHRAERSTEVQANHFGFGWG